VPSLSAATRRGQQMPCSGDPALHQEAAAAHPLAPASPPRVLVALISSSASRMSSST